MQDDIKEAVDLQQVQLLKVALQRKHPCASDHALHEAVRQANVPAVRLLLRHGSDPNARCLHLERGCEFPLQLAASCTSYLRAEDRLQAVEMLLQAGAQPGPRRGDQEANTPLHDAVRRGDLELMLLLLRHSADPNALNGFGEAPLHLALRPVGSDLRPTVSAAAMVETLLDAGASPLDEEGRGLPEAARDAAPEVVALLERWAKWWRCRHLVWIQSRGCDHPICDMMPELLLQVSTFL